MRHGSYPIIVILITPVLPLEWKKQELLRSLVYQNKSMGYITFLLIKMVTARHILLPHMLQANLLKNLNVSVIIKNVSVRGFVI